MDHQPLAYTEKHRRACEPTHMCGHTQTHVHNEIKKKQTHKVYIAFI